MTQWIAACDADDVDHEDVIPFDHAGSAYAIYRSPDDAYYATDGHCTHEQRCSATAWSWTASSSAPSTTAASTTPPARRSARRCSSTSRTYPAKVEDGTVYIELAVSEPSAQHGGDGDRRRGRVRHAGRVRPARERAGPARSRSSAPRRSSPTSARRCPRPGTLKPICDDDACGPRTSTYLPGTHATALDPHAHAVTLRRRPHARPTPSCCSPPAPRPARCRSTARRCTSSAPTPTRWPCARRLRAGTRIGGHRRRVHRAGAGRRRGGARRGRHGAGARRPAHGPGRARPHRARRGRPPRRRGGGRPLRHRGDRPRRARRAAP